MIIISRNNPSLSSDPVMICNLQLKCGEVLEDTLAKKPKFGFGVLKSSIKKRITW